MSDEYIDDLAPVDSDIEEVLFDNEQVLWSGIPQQRPRWDWTDTVLTLILISIIGFAVIWQVGVAHAAAPSWFKLVGLISSVLSITFPVMVFIRKRRIGVRYVVTNRRLIWAAGNTIDSKALRDLAPPNIVSTNESGTGTLTFGQSNHLLHLIATLSRGRAVPTREVRLIEVAHVRDVRRILVEAQRKS
ncbi:MAG: hypothetical protein M3548_11060 [Actinomycetota bacterium]|nr:hypothetical protein [Actinomycetota bacterium]